MEVRKACLFCGLNEDNELLYGKIYELDGDIVTHYFCLLLSSSMEQNGGDNDGILGFLREDILKEYRRGKRLTCWYCRKTGATLRCCMARCKKVFHLPCGRQEGSLHQFFGQFKSFCAAHRPVQKICLEVILQVKDMTATCTICCDNVRPESCPSTLWAPCCRSNAWFHRDCVQRLALSAGYFFKCPLCNNKAIFQKAMLDFGIYIPEQDASWELEPNAFQELLHRHSRCDAKQCMCPKGRNHSVVGTRWELMLCRYCGSQGIHVGCGNLKWSNPEWECDECKVMIEQAQARSDTDSDDENDASPATVNNQFPAKRKRRYFKGSGGSRRAKCRKHRVLNSASDPHPSSSQSLVMPTSESPAMTSGPVSPPTPIAVIELSDDDIVEILDDDDDDDDDNDGDDHGGDGDMLQGKAPTSGNDKMVVFSGGKAIPVIQVTGTVASNNGQNFCVVGDLDVKVPSRLYDVPAAASNKDNASSSEAVVPGSAVGGSSSYMSVHSSVDGRSSMKLMHCSPAVSRSDKQHSSPRTVTGSLLQSYLIAETDQGGHAYAAQVAAVAQLMERKPSARTRAPYPDTSSVQHGAPRPSPSNAAISPSSRVCNRPDRDRCNRQPGRYVSTSSQRESRDHGDRLTRHSLQNNIKFRVTSSNKLQVEVFNRYVIMVDVPLPPIKKPLRNRVIQHAPVVPQNVTVAMSDSNILTPQVSCFKNQVQRVMCSGEVAGVESSSPLDCPGRQDTNQDAGVGNSCSERGLEDSCLEGGTDDSCLERGLGDSCSERNIGGSCSERGLGDSCSERGIGDSCSERGISDSCSERGIGDSCSERGLGDSCSERGIGDSCSERGIGDSCSERGIGDSCSERGLGDSCSERGLGDSCSERGIGDSHSERGIGDSCSERGIGDMNSGKGFCDFYLEIGVDSETDSKVNRHFHVRSCSPVVTRSRSRCVLRNGTYLTRSWSKKMAEARYPCCRCETCRDILVQNRGIKQMLAKNDGKIRKDRECNCNTSVPRDKVARRSYRSESSYEVTPRRRSRRHTWSGSMGKHPAENTGRSVKFMNQFRDSTQVKGGSGIKQKCVTEERRNLADGMNLLRVSGNSQRGAVCSSGSGISREMGIGHSSSNALEHHNSEDVKKQKCYSNMATGVEDTSLSRTLNRRSFSELCLSDIAEMKTQASATCKFCPLSRKEDIQRRMMENLWC